MLMPGLPQPWYWPCKRIVFLSPMKKDFNYLCHLSAWLGFSEFFREKTPRDIESVQYLSGSSMFADKYVTCDCRRCRVLSAVYIQGMWFMCYASVQFWTSGNGTIEVNSVNLFAPWQLIKGPINTELSTLNESNESIERRPFQFDRNL